MRPDIEEYAFVVEHIKEKNNCGIDALLRINISSIKKIRKIHEVATRSASQLENTAIKQTN